MADLPASNRLQAQDRVVVQRMAAVDDLLGLAEVAVGQSNSLPDLLRALTLVQMQVYGARKAVIAEARTVGFGDVELARLLRLGVADFQSRYPPAEHSRRTNKLLEP